MSHILLLTLAGLLAGFMNALAGGGSFVALPALIAAGVPSVAANASSTVALYPGGAASALVYRNGLAPVCGVSAGRMLGVTLAGGLAGALLLLWTPIALFDRVLPWLLFIATLMLALGPRLGTALRARWLAAAGAVLAVQFALGLYGGYFGGAVGLMMIAAWSLLADADIKALNPPRTLMVTAANTAAALCFIAAGTVYWVATLLVGAGALLGGYLGAYLGKRLPPVAVRAATLLIAAGMTVVFFARAYG
ncbi:UPF0721 transmembrane protein [Labrys miyagiensis]|uniref:Probable membrane transporter protein n=1 Tax=Labrys miyagiensis TaxID=346912 RepID=A0ABQ6CBT8_9HYPH|nr:sulfite exporter TauE/SafE family protein [Labrys miyagiensis]GLS17773.1 UPF0721 transmembrane protein [Labrys miyagiensis]